MEVFRNDVWQSRKTRKFCYFWPWGHNFDVSEKIDFHSFVIIFDELSNAFFRFSLRPIGAEIAGGGGVQTPPSPVGSGKSGVPVGRGLNACTLSIIFAQKLPSRGTPRWCWLHFIFIRTVAQLVERWTPGCKSPGSRRSGARYLRASWWRCSRLPPMAAVAVCRRQRSGGPCPATMWVLHRCFLILPPISNFDRWYGWHFRLQCS